jgi:hypothetical protein
MRSRFFLSTLLVIFISPGCKEVYYPELDSTKTSLVVIGMITDVPGAYTIKLSKAMSFYAASSNPEAGAIVYVEDAEGNQYPFVETIPGNYVSDPYNFITKYGETYTLIIQTKDGKGYKSSPQTLYSKGVLDSLYAVVKSAPLITYFGEKPQLLNFSGAEFLASIDLTNDLSPYYRFSNTLLVEYISDHIATGADTPFLTEYCWQKYIPYQFLNLSDRHNTTNKTQQLLGFCPIDPFYYGIISAPVYYKGVQIGEIKKRLQLFKITFKQYHLNPDIYKYYVAVNSQLAASQQVLDPITVQCIGNITCIKDPNEPVMGIFEASSLSMFSYMYSREAGGSLIDLQRISTIDIEQYPASDCQSMTPPYFWTKK